MENLRQFGALKAMGASTFTLARMILLQAFTVGLTGYGVGIGLATVFGYFSARSGGLPFIETWQLLLLVLVALLAICTFSALISIIKLARLRAGHCLSVSMMDNQTQPAAVSLSGIVKSFGTGDTKVTVLRGIDLDIYLGEMLLLVGESGGGKTTLLSAIAGILDVDEGDIDVLGVPLSDLPAGKRTTFRGQTMGFIYQQFNLLPNLTDIWLRGDHYKWRAMRANGIAERLITGDASDAEKFQAWAATVPKTLRNPLYHWTHLELKRYFGVSGKLLNPETAEAIYTECSAMLRG